MRMNLSVIFSCIIGATLCISGAYSVSPFSKYGQIQNVQTYSSNPFYNQNSPYNQTMPQPVYALGPSIQTSDCQSVLATLVAQQCSMMNNCQSARLSDIRPAIMLQLSRMPGGNYATSCSGYLDSAFENYKKNFSYNTPTAGATFPAATVPNPNADVTNPQIKIFPDAQKPQWATEMAQRKQELKELQAASGANDAGLEYAEFQKTYADLSFTERMANEAAGFEPYKDKKAYDTLKIESEQEYLEKQAALSRINSKSEDSNNNTKTNDNEKNPNLITDHNYDEFEALLPWYGILVVKAGSLDKYAALDLPIISTEYMKAHRDEFYPANSDQTFGHGCTYYNHTANDNDIINRATYNVMGEENNFFSGSDYYVFDGSDVYWGWATIAGEVALALLTLGISAEASAAKTALQVTSAGAKTIAAASKTKGLITVGKLTTNAEKLKKAAEAAKAVKAGDAASKTKAIDALADAGITVKNTAKPTTFKNIATALDTAIATAKPVKWTSSLSKPWRLVKSGAKDLVSNKLGRGATWKTRFKTLGVGAAGVGLNYLGKELLKSFGYSSSMIQDPTTGDVAFNSFGLLSDDDEEGRENVVSHGAWIQFNEIGTANENDAVNEALVFADELKKEIDKLNASDPLCDIDIYVVQPAISNPEKLPGARQIYYILQNDDQKIQVRTK